LVTAFVDGWPVQPNAGVIDVTVPITASGRLRRIWRQSTAYSAMRRSVPRYAPVRAYWPLENGSLQSPITGVPDLRLVGGVAWGSSPAPASDTLPTFTATTRVSGSVAGMFSAAAYSVDWLLNMPTAPAAAATVMQVRTSGDIGTFSVTVSASAITLTSTDVSGISTTWATGTPTGLFGEPTHLRIQLSRLSVNLSAELDWIGVVSGTSHSINGVGGSASIGQPTLVSVGRDVNLDGCQVGHVVVTDSVGNTAIDGAWTAWAGELAADRVARLCAEAGIEALVA
jgi:hypothetical protein